MNTEHSRIDGEQTEGTDAKVTRRAAIGMLVAGTGATALPWVASNAAVLETTAVAQQVDVIASASVRGEVVSFFMDLPYIDRTGLAKPYVPPAFTDRNYDVALSAEASLWSQYC